MLIFGKLKLGQGKPLAKPGSALANIIKETDDMLSDALEYSRTLVSELSPPVLRDRGLAPALRWLVLNMKKFDLNVALHVPDEHRLHLTEDQCLLLFQSVRELLINSSKHAGTHDVWVTLEQRRTQLVIEVEDKGRGFDVAAVADSKDLSSKFGLFSIQERMRALGGTFDVHSAPSKGTLATLILPLQDAEASHQVSLPGIPVLTGDLRDGYTRPQEALVRLLLVDDHALVRQGLRSVLTGYSDLEIVAEAGDGIEALGAVEQHRPAIVIMDINMPNMNGVEATACIKARFPDIQVIGLSVNSEQENREAMLKAGAATLLPKEAVVEDLYNTILDTMGREKYGTG
jgi:CheY-like chemotaxis protein